MCYCTPEIRTPVCQKCASWLAKENERLSELATKWNQECDDYREDNKRLAQDAARYQWLRQGYNDEMVMISREGVSWLPRGEKLDIAIDKIKDKQ